MNHTATSTNKLAGQIKPLTQQQSRQLKAAIDHAKVLQAEQLRRRGGVPFPSSSDTLRELREERSRQLP